MSRVRRLRLELTPAQLHMVNRALAREEAEDHSDDESYRPDVMERTRREVWNVMVAGGIEP